jgi:UDP-N-acetylglucosamine diphosphorylase/glucosamine-1-phosphate N-acetyltransferase
VRDVARRMVHAPLWTDCNIVLFEDDRTAAELFPLTVVRPSWEIGVGAGCLRSWLQAMESPGTPLLLRSRPVIQARARELAQLEEDERPEPEIDTLFVNGRVIGLWNPDEESTDLPATVVDRDGRVLLARRSGRMAEEIISLDGNAIARRLVQQLRGEVLPGGWTLLYARYAWDYMLHNAAAIMRQLEPDTRGTTEWMGGHTMRELPVGVQMTNRTGGHPVFVEPSVHFMPCVVLGNHHGPIWIGGQTEIEPHAYLEGPLHIGPNCRIKASTRLYGGTRLGPGCRVAGEISNSNLQEFVNKQHDGFVGSSLIGSWVNLGADTRVSNLRNDYGEVKVQVGNELVATGERFMGLMMGDHTRTGINTMFNTGTVVGVGANVYGAGYPPRFVGSFRRGGAEGLKAESLERTLAGVREMMARRDHELSPAEENVLRAHYAETVEEEFHS